MKTFKIQGREAGNVIETGLTLEEAKTILTAYEELDHEEGNYTPDFYEIKEEGVGVELKKINLLKRRDGRDNETVQSYFIGENIPEILDDAEYYLRGWLEGYNNSLSQEETDGLFENFDGTFSYDVWNFHLEEEIEEGEEV